MAEHGQEKLSQEKNINCYQVSSIPDIEHGSALAINASGHTQETLRQFSFLSLLATGVATNNCWTNLAGTLVVAISNGGPPGVIYEFIAACIFYLFIHASLAELASAMPSSGGVYHFASVCGGKEHGRVCGWFAGWWNFLAYLFGTAGFSTIMGNQLITMYGLFRPDFEPKAWHVLICYLILTWMCCCTVLFMNRLLPLIEKFSMLIILMGCFFTILVCAFMPKANAVSYSSHGFVWKDWKNATGWSSNGFVFAAGMLNGAWGIGTPDFVTHLAEEIPRPGTNVPKAIMYQYLVGFVSGFFFLIAIFYAINDLEAVINSSTSFPLTEIYRQTTGSAGGALALMLLIFFSSFVNLIGAYVGIGRIYWTLSRDGVTPFSAVFAKVHPRRKNPFNATIFCGCACSVLGCIYVGSVTAFNAFISSSLITCTLSYLAAILPHLLSRRRSVEPGPFWMGGWLGWAVNAVSCGYIVVFAVIFCFPYSMPVDASTMNYASLMTGGLSLFVAAWWFVKRDQYQGPQFVPRDSSMLAKDAM
ncbi:MAG: hypothetical protein Q9208_000027 [Pyrenodesmia sp. 3 TL-2023]